jgi:hypothetical protein
VSSIGRTGDGDRGTNENAHWAGRFIGQGAPAFACADTAFADAITGRPFN